MTTLKDRVITVASIGCGVIAGGLAAKAAFEIAEKCCLGLVPAAVFTTAVGSATCYTVAESIYGTVEFINEICH